ncbi:MAG: hypothetical protein P1U42_03540 [Phycisphaerales bacterium]|nr:hypothetical protein [Phycisphaerales bacterium]
MDEIGSGNSDHQGTEHLELQNELASNKQSDHLRLADINHEEYDALADLFLDGGSFAPEQAVIQDSHLVETESDSDIDVPNHDTHTPVLQLTSCDESEPFEPEASSMRILETLDATNANASALLAELLGEQDAGVDEHDLGYQEHAGSFDVGDSSEPVLMPNPTLEVVVLGHLPVRATLWARQYACSQAKDNDEVVALIRAASGSTAVDLITSGEEISSRTYAHIDDAIASVSVVADRVILRVDSTSEPELLDRPEVEGVTILTGADEAAVVASYRLIKTLDATLGEQLEDGFAPLLRLAVMGAGAEQAQDACEKLRNAVDTFIHRPIEIVAGSARIDATGTKNIYRDSVAYPVSQIVDLLVAAAMKDDEPLTLHLVDDSDFDSDEPVADLESVIDDDRREHAVVEFPSAGVPLPEPKMSRRAKRDLSRVEMESGIETHNELESNELEMDSRSEDVKSINAKPADAPTHRDGLCALIDGLSPIEARCPKAPGVELAIDASGRLHLVVCDADTDDAMNRLLATQTWARNNLGLLLRAEPGLGVPSASRDVDTDATMHLISEDPRNIREIYDTTVRIYALARVRVGNIVAQVATAIN